MLLALVFRGQGGSDRPAPVVAEYDEQRRLQVGPRVLEAARERGFPVPARLSVVGVDDRPQAAFTTPPLTTLRQPFERLGEEAIRLLVQRLEGKSVPATMHLFKPELVARGSTAPPSL